MTDAFTLATAQPVDDFPRDRYGRPMIVPADGGKPIPYGRPSSFGKKLEDTYGLEQWQRRMMTVGLARTPSLVARAATIPGDPKAWTKAHKADLNAIADEALIAAKANQAADIGTSLHRMTELADLSDDVSHLPEPFAADVAAYRAGMAAHGFTIDPTHVECRMVCDELRLAGTTDRIPFVPTIGQHRILDLKTGESIELAALGYAVQLAVYAHSVLYDVATGQRTPIDLDLATALIVHLPAGQASFTLYDVDVAAGWQAALVCAEIDRWRKRKNLLVAVPAPDVSPLAAASAEVSALQDAITVSTVNAADYQRDNLLRRCRKVAEISPAGAEWLKAELVKRDLNVKTATVAEFPLIEEVLHQAETATDAPFDPLPTTPVGLAVSDRISLPVLDADPDEGPTLGHVDPAFIEMQSAYGRLDEASRAWIGTIIDEALRAGRPLHMGTTRTLRRARIALGLALLAGEECNDAESVRALVHLATGVDVVLFPSVPLGAAVSIMSATEAAAFCAAVDLFLDGELTASVDADGHVRLGGVSAPVDQHNISRSDAGDHPTASAVGSTPTERAQA